jgi:hypothetical protein
LLFDYTKSFINETGRPTGHIESGWVLTVVLSTVVVSTVVVSTVVLSTVVVSPDPCVIQL